MSIKGMTPAIEAAGYGISGSIGGLRRQTYYTPDGRTIKAVPQIREFIIKDKQGNVLDSGTRDANLDRGLLLQMPQVKKPFCPTCDRWHDTLIQVKKCKIIQDRKLAKFEAQAQAEKIKEHQDKDIKIDALEKQLAELKAMVQQLVEARK